MITVTTAATKFNLIDVATARAALGYTDNSNDVALSGFVDRASAVITEQCDRVFALETITEQFRLDECAMKLLLARYPVVELVSIVENDITLDAAEYELDDIETAVVTRLHGDRPCHWSPCKITVVYSAGFTLPTDTPERLKQACIQLVKSYAMGFDRDPMTRSESADNISSASYFDGDHTHLPPEVVGLIAPFRNIRTR